MKLGSKELTLPLLVVFLILSSCLILPVGATPCAILKVSLPAGTYVGYNDNPWLSECWLLNLTGACQTFTVRINNTSASLRSYDTHLVIALNSAGYANLVSLVVNGTSVPKSAFNWGTPKPYNLWNWPSGDVYPTYFNDNCINVGLISKKGYKELVVSVTFSDASGIKMHFDAYGKKVSGPPQSDGDITHNGISEDSTVLLQAGPPPPQPPIANFFFDPYFPETNQMVTFNASESYDPDGYIVSYAWDFGDGTPIVVENDPITTHAYTNYGDFTVKLTVTDNSGLTSEKTSALHVSQHPIASFTFSPPDPLIHESVTFDGSASTPDGGTITSYTWNFGDGNITTESDPVITHAYATYGTYTITLNVTDSEGKWDTQSQMITVEKAPIADFWWSPYYPQRDESVTFDGSASTPDGGTITSYTWNFGDGNITTESDPVIIHSYASMGDYTVTLNVTDSEGRWDTESKIISVVARRYFLEVNTDPSGVTTIPGEGWYNEGTNVDLTAPDTVPVSTGVRYKFSYWDVDGTPKSGNPITVTMDANHTATAHYVLQYYLTVRTDPSGIATILGEGWYNSSKSVSLTAPSVSGYTFLNWDVDGVSQGSGVSAINVHMDAPHIATAHYAIIPPSLSISISPPSASICVGQSTAFTSTVSGGITPYSYQWYLNGSSVSGATSSSWAFSPTAPGTYSVYLKVTDKNGNTAQSAPATVNVSPAGGVPVGGYSISLVKQTPVSSMTMYAMLIALFGAALSLTKRKRK